MVQTVRDLDRLTQCLIADVGTAFARWGARRVGINWRMNCPWRPNSDSDSITLHAEHGAWHDHRDNVAGNIITFYARAFHNGNERECILARAAQYGIEIIDVPANELPNSRPRSRPQLHAVPNERTSQVDNGTEAHGPAILDWSGEVPPLAPYRNEVARWLYHSRDGHPILMVVRIDKGNGKKDFWPHTLRRRRSWGDESRPPEWAMKGLIGVQQPLLGQHEFNDKPIIVTEGEKACVAARGRLCGDTFQATCWPGGAKNAEHADVESLRGKDVILWPDDDEPGVEAMTVFRSRLVGVASRIRTITVAGNGNGDDAADMIEQIESIGGLSRFIDENSTELQPAADQDRPAPALLRTNRGDPVACEANAAALIGAMSSMDNLYFDTFAQAIMIGDRTYEASDTVMLTPLLQQQIHGLRPTHVDGGIEALARSRSRDSLIEYMRSLTWDRVPRIDRFATEYLGAEDNELTRAISRNLWLSLAVRALRPGSKVDQMVILEGEQGTGKSAAVREMCPNPDWHAELHSTLGSTDSVRELQGRLIVEVAELANTTKADVLRMKLFLAQQVDKFVDKFQRRATVQPRRAILIGTTNQQTYLRDETGNRRFIPLRTGVINLSGIRQVRDQCFAEAAAAIADGEQWWNYPSSIVAEQESRIQDDLWDGPIREWLATAGANLVKTVNARDGLRRWVATENIALHALSMPLDRMDQSALIRINRVMSGMGWRKSRQRSGSALAWGYSGPMNESQTQDSPQQGADSPF